MSLITTTDVRRDQIAATEDVVREHLRRGMASVIEPGAAPGIFITWCIAPNEPGLGLAFGIRRYNTELVELGERAGAAIGSRP